MRTTATVMMGRRCMETSCRWLLSTNRGSLQIVWSVRTVWLPGRLLGLVVDDGSCGGGIAAGDETDAGEGHGGHEGEDAGIREHGITSEQLRHRRLLLGSQRRGKPDRPDPCSSVQPPRRP